MSPHVTRREFIEATLLPVCTGQRAPYDRTLFWRITGFDAVRAGDWKYLKDRAGEYLFNVIDDPSEKADLRTTYPDRFEALRSRYREWADRMLPLPPVSS